MDSIFSKIETVANVFESVTVLSFGPLPVTVTGPR